MTNTSFFKVATLAMAFSLMAPMVHGAVNKDAVKKASAEYTKLGNEITAGVKGGTAKEADIAAKIDGMAAQAHVVMKEYAAKYPEAKKLVDYLISKTGDMKKMKFKTLEDDWHDAGALTSAVVGIDLKDEKNEKFLDPCHILIHPMMVLAGVREANHKGAAEELNEGMEQMKTSETELLK